jgi:epoxyqueuosine reductase
MSTQPTNLVDLVLTEELKTLAISRGLDLVGVGSVDRFAGVASGFRPTDYLPGARTVVSFALAIADGICDAWGTFEEEGKSPLPYMYYGVGNANWELARVANQMARRLESRGYRTAIFPPHWSVSHFRSLTTEPTGWMLPRVNNAIPQDFPHLVAAVAAGLGEIGWSGLVLTPDFGARIRLNSVVTDAPLAVDPLYAGPPLCQPERCDYACAKGCPAGALATGEIGEVTVGDRTHRFGRLDAVRCQYGLDGLVRGAGGRTAVDIPPGPGRTEHYRESLARFRPEDAAFHGSSRGLLGGTFCERCLHQCPAHTWGREAR